MSFYFIIAALLWALAFASLHSNARRYADILALVIFIAVAGLRQHTGYDWMLYEDYFHAIGGHHCYRGPVFEPLYWLINAPLAVITTQVWTVFLLIAALNGAAFLYFCRVFAVGFALPAALYFCWIYLPLQMGVLRQSLAVSAFLIAISALEQQRRARAGGSAVIGIGFQFSALMYLPALLPGLLQRMWKYTPWIVGVLLVSLVLLPSPARTLFMALAAADLPVISDKLRLYNEQSFSRLSTGALGYLLLNAAFVLGLWWRRRNGLSRSEALLLMPLTLMLVLQTLMADLPILWNRLQYLAIPCQAVLIARLLGSWRYRAIAMAMLLVLSMAALVHSLRHPMMRPYYPYLHLFSAKDDSGRQRMLQYYVSYYESRNLPLPPSLLERIDQTKTDAEIEAQYRHIPCARLAPAQLLGYAVERPEEKDPLHVQE